MSDINTNKDVTLFITSCGRQDLLKRTIESFVQFNTYPIKEAIIIEDSGHDGINEFVKELVLFPCVTLYNTTRLGQMKSIEKGVKHIKTPYVFHCEDDWEFFNPGFIEKSMEILDINNNISQVLLRPYTDYYSYNFTIDKSNDIRYNYIRYKRFDLYSFNPSLRRLEIQMLNMPYNDWDDEYTILLKINELGYFAVVTPYIQGFVRHIGDKAHIDRIPNIKYRSDFPEYSKSY